MPNIRQTNFSGGELSPTLWGRTDLAKFGTGLRRCRNFFISRQGAAISRPGTTYLSNTKNQVTNKTVRLVPFIASDTESYVLEFGHQYIRFHTNGGTVPSWFLNYSHALLNEIPVYSPIYPVGGIGTDIPNAVVAGVTATSSTTGILYLVGLSGAYVNGNQFTNGIPVGQAVGPSVFAGPYEIATPYSHSDLALLKWAQTGDVLTLTHPSHAPQELVRSLSHYWKLTPVAFATVSPYFQDIESPYTATLKPMVVDGADPPGGTSPPVPTPDASHPPREWTWKVTAVAQDTTSGFTFESVPETVDEMYNGITAASAVDLLTAHPTISVYPDMAVVLRRPTPLSPPVAPAGWDGYKPAAFNYYRGRGDLFGFIGQTKTRDFVDIGDEPDYSIQPPIGRNPFAVYNYLGDVVRTETPFAVTFFQERRVFGGTKERPGTFFASATGSYRNHDERVLIHVPGEALIYELASRRREEIRSMAVLGRLLILTNSSVWSVAGNEGSPLDFDHIDARVELDIGANHLPPLAVDGVLLFARNKGSGVRSLVPNGNSGFNSADLSVVAQHLVTPATLNEIVDWTYAEDPWGMVWAVRSDGKLLSLTYSQSDEIWAWAWHDTDGAVKNICSVPEGDEDAVYMVVTRGSTTTIERMTSRQQLGAGTVDICIDSTVHYVGAPTQVITGIPAHLEGKQVYVLSVGNPPFGPLTVTGGQVTLPEMPAGVGTISMYIGLAYTLELETLDLAHSESRTRQKSVTSVCLEVDASRGLWVGPDFDHLTEWRQRQVSLSYGTISNATELVRVPVLDKWGVNARAALRQTLPLPLTVVGITREVEIGGS